MRINQYVATASGLSRRAADAAIASGRVTINGRNAAVGETVTENPRIELDGRRLTLPSHHTYLLLHKPVGYVTSRVRQGSDPTIYDLLPAKYRRLRTAGRLDRDSSGLLLLSDDGHFIQRHSHPSEDKDKVYELVLNRPLAAADVAALERGIQLTDGPSQLRVLAHHGAQVTVSLSEGRNRQIRRTLGALGYGIVQLHRVKVGAYQLGQLPAGQWQEFIPGEPTQ